MQELIVGDVVSGILESERDTGFVFRTTDGLSGLLPRSEFFWIRPRMGKPQFPEIGSALIAKVLESKPKRDRLGNYITFSVRALLPNPWEIVEGAYPIGTRIRAKISGFTEVGAVIDLPSELSILIHNTQVSWQDPNATAEGELSIGQLIEVVVIESKKSPKRLHGSCREATADPWPKFAQEAPPGTVFIGTISGLAEYGAFVKLESGFVGLMHRTQNPDFLELRMGERVKVAIISIDPISHRASLAPVRSAA